MKFASVHDIQAATPGEAMRAKCDENRRRYIAQSAMTKAGQPASLPSLEEVSAQIGRFFQEDALERKGNRGETK